MWNRENLVVFFWASGGSRRVVRISSMALAALQRM
jgi:hypothetical protein